MKERKEGEESHSHMEVQTQALRHRGLSRHHLSPAQMNNINTIKIGQQARGRTYLHVQARSEAKKSLQSVFFGSVSTETSQQDTIQITLKNRATPGVNAMPDGCKMSYFDG